ncbi:hypothetical protein [Streptacidiphilus jiangxiensis]|uniref:hypothetical protein n=1 Tax=Streptacidiphilus jiangxiensis TaxID=235985 RepID=UPI0011600CFD|nr:hypothetical protein [Streptacidiphilus jiangxiensis]
MPWLDPAAAYVYDYGTSIPGRGARWHVMSGSILRVDAGVYALPHFYRHVAVVFGFDGDLSSRILEVIRLVEQSGWQLRLQNSRHRTTDRQWPVRAIAESNGAALGSWVGREKPPCLAQGGEGTPCSTQVVWTSRDIPDPNPAYTTLNTPPYILGRNVPDGPTWSDLPLEFSGPQPPVEIGDFAAPALESHEHAVAVLVELTYFVCWPGQRPRGIPKRLIPRPW